MMRRCVVGVAIAVLVAGSMTFAQSQRRTEKFVVGPFSETEFVVGHCADGNFDVLSDWVALMRGTDRYDKSGQFVQEVLLYDIIGEATYYNSLKPGNKLTGIPAEHES